MVPLSFPRMDPIDQLAEQKIREAQERGVFDNRPGCGRPLALEDLALVPEPVRAAYRLLKNAGFVPPEIEILREIGAAQARIQEIEDPAQRREALKRLRLLELRALERSRP